MSFVSFCMHDLSRSNYQHLKFDQNKNTTKVKQNKQLMTYIKTNFNQFNCKTILGLMI